MQGKIRLEWISMVVKTPAARGKLVDRSVSTLLWKAKPARRIYIPKANKKLRPLGIPVVIDRCLQAMVKNALEPAWEAKFEGRSYGFRPGRSATMPSAKSTFWLDQTRPRNGFWTPTLEEPSTTSRTTISVKPLVRFLEGTDQTVAQSRIH